MEQVGNKERVLGGREKYGVGIRKAVVGAREGGWQMNGDGWGGAVRL